MPKKPPQVPSLLGPEYYRSHKLPKLRFLEICEFWTVLGSVHNLIICDFCMQMESISSYLSIDFREAMILLMSYCVERQIEAVAFEEEEEQAELSHKRIRNCCWITYREICIQQFLKKTNK